MKSEPFQLKHNKLMGSCRGEQAVEKNKLNKTEMLDGKTENICVVSDQVSVAFPLNQTHPKTEFKLFFFNLYNKNQNIPLSFPTWLAS